MWVTAALCGGSAQSEAALARGLYNALSKTIGFIERLLGKHIEFKGQDEKSDQKIQKLGQVYGTQKWKTGALPASVYILSLSSLSFSSCEFFLWSGLQGSHIQCFHRAGKGKSLL